MFGKAKKKILGEKDEVEEGGSFSLQSSVYKSPATGSISGYDPTMWEPQELGQRERERENILFYFKSYFWCLKCLKNLYLYAHSIWL